MFRFSFFRTLFASILCAAMASPLFCQKKALSLADIPTWRKIEQSAISNDGKWVIYNLAPTTEGDPALHLWSADKETTTVFPRGTEAKFTDDAHFLIFKIKQPLDSLKALRRKKAKEEDLPKDSLGIFALESGQLTKIPKVKNFSIPDKWAGWMAYQLEAEKSAIKKDTTAAAQDSTAQKPKAKKDSKKVKKENKDNGFKLVLRELGTAKEDTVAFVQGFVFAEKGKRLLLHSTGRDSNFLAGVYLFNAENRQLKPLFRSKGKYQNLALDEWGNQAAFLADTDTSKARVRPWQLAFWANKQDSARILAGPQSDFLPVAERPSVTPTETPARWGISEYAQPVFSEDGSKLYFGMAPPPVLQDTMLLPEEIVSVEVWSWKDEYLHTQQKVQLDADKKRNHKVVYRIGDKKFVPIGSKEIPEIRLQEGLDAEIALGWTEKAYAQDLIWEGQAAKDVYAIHLKTGKKELVARKVRGNVRLSPAAKFIYWFSEPDSAWFAWNVRSAKTIRLTDNQRVSFFEEETDVPDLPGEYGFAGWLKGDEGFLVYDRYDIWKIDPFGKRKPQCLTLGRQTETIYRYLRLDREERSIHPDSELLLHQFNEQTKSEGYAWLDLESSLVKPWMSGDYAFSRAPIKAKNAWEVVFTKENFQTFPDLQLAVQGKTTKISDANPQQKEYQWGSIELVRWTSLDGIPLTGMLVKPEGYDPNKKYPMIVNFYEKSSDGLFQYRAPDFGRSQINYTLYASRGYLVFNPDIPYREGYPGESALNALLPGVTALIDKGMVDPKRIGIQGHSWGGYQTAYLLTKTNLFACAEAGAPVVNMVSAYGGIRWESGRSRIFQYEHQQSRIGGSLWRYPLRFLENSPIFSLDKVQTPVLILHNDKDGAVPWYQGIEYFTGLVRLGKPAWLLNYNDEPHWPVKLQNRMDFQTRMLQFFDFYLMGGTKPKWMEHGVPAIEKGILQGLDGW